MIKSDKAYYRQDGQLLYGPDGQWINGNHGRMATTLHRSNETRGTQRYKKTSDRNQLYTTTTSRLWTMHQNCLETWIFISTRIRANIWWATFVKLGVEPITHDPEYVTGYGMKGLKRSSFSEDDVLIFPRTVSELPAKGPDPRKGPIRAAGEKPMYDFQRK
jgi:hypothetical protein